MESVNAIYDGHAIRFTEPIPVHGKYEVVVTFMRSLENIEKRLSAEEKEAKKQRLMSFVGTWDEEDVKLMEQMVAERSNIFKRRGNDDIS